MIRTFLRHTWPIWGPIVAVVVLLSVPGAVWGWVPR